MPVEAREGYTDVCNRDNVEGGVMKQLAEWLFGIWHYSPFRHFGLHFQRSVHSVPSSVQMSVLFRTELSVTHTVFRV